VGSPRPLCIVFLLARIFISGLHSFMNICVNRLVVGGVMNLVSLYCASVKCVLSIVLKCVCCSFV
jgi:hypothetical protein